MAEKLTEEIKMAIENPDSVIVLSAVGADGNPYSELGVKVELVREDRIAYYELLESSQLQKNLVNSLWFDKEVVLLVTDPSRENYLITGTVYRALIAGRQFEEQYIRIQEEFGEDADLSTVWLIDVKSAFKASYPEGRRREKQEHPLLMHLDHIFVKAD